MKLLKALVFAFLFTSLSAFAAPVNVNTANAEALAANLNGVGPKIAQAIIDHRTKNGPFKTVEGLMAVKGIGSKLLDRNRDNILLSQPVKSGKK